MLMGSATLGLAPWTVACLNCAHDVRGLWWSDSQVHMSGGTGSNYSIERVSTAMKTLSSVQWSGY